MDDFLDSCDTIEEAKERIEQVKIINKAADWDMHAWGSNFLEVLNDTSNVQGIKESPIVTDGSEERILGLKWNTESDTLMLRYDKKKVSDKLGENGSIPTKRKFLALSCPSSIHSAYFLPLLYIHEF